MTSFIYLSIGSEYFCFGIWAESVGIKSTHKLANDGMMLGGLTLVFMWYTYEAVHHLLASMQEWVEGTFKRERKLLGFDHADEKW